MSDGMAHAARPKMANARRGLVALATCVACGGPGRQDTTDDSPRAGEQSHWSSIARSDAGAERTPALPPLVAATRVTLGEFSSGEAFSLVIPPDTVGVSLIAEGTEGSARFETVRSPSGTLVLENGHILGSAGTGVRDLEARVTTTAIPLHATADAPLEAGGWSITLNVNSATRWRVRAMLQTIPGGEYAGGALDVHVFIPDGMTISDPATRHILRASSASTDGSLNFRLDLFFDALKRWFSIDRGTIVFHDMPAESAAGSSWQLENYASGEPNAQALHVVLSNAQSGVSGVSGMSGVTTPRSPATIGFSDTNVSSVVLQHNDSPAETDVTALLQGFGRAVGLPYTTDAAREDPYPDTPSCPLTVKREDCPDATNLMFRWLPSAVPTVAPSQVRVVTRSPLLRAYLPGKKSALDPRPTNPGLAAASLQYW